MELVGKMLKSKINGNLFYVADMFTEDNRQFYTISDPAAGGCVAIEKGWFEVGYMQNFEIVGETGKERHEKE